MIYGDIFINPAKTCAVTGNRYLLKNFDRLKLENEFIKFIEDGYDTFLIGMAIGFDTVCFHTLEKIRKQKSIKIIACIPCENQDAKFSEECKIEYQRMLSVSDAKIFTGKQYTSKCMQVRNEFMVDNSSLLFAYMKKDKGGTVNTVNYALKKGKRIIFL